MERKRVEPVAERVPHMSETARAEIETLRASDRLQRIFQSDLVAGRHLRRPPPGGTPAPSRDEVPTRHVETAGSSEGRGFLLSRRARVVAGLFPVCLATAVLAVEGVRALRDEPEALAFVSTGGPPHAEAGVESADLPRTTTAAAEGGRRQADRIGIRPENGAGEGHREGGPVRPTLAPELSAMPRSRPSEPAAARRQGGAGAKASDDLAKSIDGARVAPPRAERGQALRADQSTSPTAPSELAGAPTKTAELDRTEPMAGDAVQAPPLEVPEAVLGAAETVPQATWSGEARAPVPAPRFARLSEVLAERSAAAASAEEPRALARSTHPGAAPRAASRRPDAAAPPSPDPAARGPVPLAGSVPPRIVVHYRREAGPAAARRVASELLARGYARTELRPVAFAISRANVRYFHEQNRPVARDVNELVQATGSRSDLRDFTHYAPLPTVGTVEVWLPG